MGGMQALDDSPTASYLERLVARARGVLGDELVGAYVVNSGARDDYLAGRSDIDVVLVVASPMSAERKAALAGAVRHGSLPCPASKLELVVYRRAAVADPGPRPAFELNLNTGPAMDDHLTTDPANEPAFWFVLDLAAAAHASVTLTGPRGAELFGHVARADVLAALTAAQAWYAANEPLAPNRVLNDCRAWRWAATGRWSSKAEAAAWAIEKGADAALVTHALALRRGDRDDPLPLDRVEALATAVARAIQAASG